VPRREAGSGIARLSGSWTLLNRGENREGKLVFSSDQRHRYTARAPGQYDALESGYHGITGTPFSDVGLVMGDFNWQQKLNEGTASLIVGRYDPNDFFDVLGYANPWTTFSSLALLFNPTIALPDWSYGISGGQWFNDQFYLKGGVNDANGTIDELGFLDGGSELYTTAELGWSPSSAERYLANVHIMGWHVDERSANNIGSRGHGVAFGGNWTWDETYMLFSKLGWSEGTSQLYNESVTLGGIYRFPSRSDLLGLGLNWGSPSLADSRDQYTSELFYRIQFAQNLALTPSVQLLVDPASNPSEDQVWVGGIRARLTF
jgi:porin